MSFPNLDFCYSIILSNAVGLSNRQLSPNSNSQAAYLNLGFLTFICLLLGYLIPEPTYRGLSMGCCPIAFEVMTAQAILPYVDANAMNMCPWQSLKP